MSGKTIPVKMAKATEEDFKSLRLFFQMLSEYFDYGTYTEPSEDFEEESIDLTPEKMHELLEQMWKRGVDSSWTRVVFGCEMLIDNVCDPNQDVLEWKPEICEILEAAGYKKPEAETV